MNKNNIIMEIATLLESDCNAVPMDLQLLEILDNEELIKIKSSLVKSKNYRNKKEETEKLLNDIAKNCSKD